MPKSRSTDLTEDSEYILLKLLELNPQATQREIASEMGVSLGKVNYCVQALVAKGLVKATNFKNSQRKAAYMYLLTPKGIRAKAVLSLRYLRRKVQEYEAIKAEDRRKRDAKYAETQKKLEAVRCRNEAKVKERKERQRLAVIARDKALARARQMWAGMSRARAAAAARFSSSTPAPDSPITSSGPVTGKAATGTPQANASSMTSPKVSVRLGNTKTSAAE